VLLGTDTTAPYSFTWSSVPAGTYWITAVARDLDGGTTSSFASGITVTGVAGTTPWMVAFTASADHATNVTSYLVEVFASGADPNTATPIASSDLGKPALNSLGEVIVDRTSFFEALAAGNYVMTVRAIGPGGSTRSAAYTFTR
jgi:chitinase